MHFSGSNSTICLMELSLYIHIPYCLKKCRYCDFNSQETSAGVPGDYLPALVTEMETRRRHLPEAPVATTLYIGGGTPSLLVPDAISSLVEAARRIYGMTDSAEITMEANPGTLSLENLRAYRAAGINRLSLGVQSFDDSMLRLLGRIHTVADSIAAVGMARQAGFDNIGIDLIHSLPGQSAAHWQTELNQAIDLKPEHISAYGLTVEEETPLHDLVDSGAFHLPPEDEAATIYSLTSRCLAAAGYAQYEISNFARPGRQSRHNMAYWRWTPYVGFGAGAHSFLPVPFPGERWSNHTDSNDYIATLSNGALPEATHSHLTIREASAEWLFLGLRTSAGIDPEQFLSFFKFPVENACDGAITELIDEGLLIRAGGRIRLAESAFILSNQIFVRLV